MALDPYGNVQGLTVTLVGGGNSTLCLAPLIASAGYTVNILTRQPEKWAKEIEVVNEDMGFMRATSIKCSPDLITKDPAACIPQSDIIWFAGVPVHHNPSLLKTIKEHMVKSRHYFIGTICCYGGFEWVAQRELGVGNYTCFGTQLIPWCCGTKKYGETGVIFGAKRVLRIATTQGLDRLRLKSILAPMLRQPLEDTHFLASTLWPNNAMIHPPILYGLFKDWDGKTPFDEDKVPKAIYAEMTDASGQCVATMDAEMQAINAALRKLFPNDPHLQKDFRMRECILQNYIDQVSDPTDVTSCFRTNSAFAKHNIPYTTVSPGKVVPTIAHKFFETDLPYGLVTFRDIADMVKVDVPFISAMIAWNQKLVDKEYMLPDGTLKGKDIGEAIVPSLFGITVDKLLS